MTPFVAPCAQAVSTLCQGSAADLVKTAMVALARRLCVPAVPPHFPNGFEEADPTVVFAGTPATAVTTPPAATASLPPTPTAASTPIPASAPAGIWPATPALAPARTPSARVYGGGRSAASRLGAAGLPPLAPSAPGDGGGSDAGDAMKQAVSIYEAAMQRTSGVQQPPPQQQHNLPTARLRAAHSGVMGGTEWRGAPNGRQSQFHIDLTL